MSKIIVEKIQKPGGAPIIPPADAPVDGKIVISADGTPNQMAWGDQPTYPTYPEPWADTLRPVLFAINTGFQNGNYGSYGWSSELGTWYSGYQALKLSFVTGRSSYSTTSGDNYSNWSWFPSLQYINPQGSFGFAREQTVNQASSNQYNYPDKLLMCVFVKNTTGADITSTFYYAGASYWNSGYEGACVGTLTPDATNTAIAANPEAITSLSANDVWTYGNDSSSYAANASITVPADKTIAIIFYTSGRYYTSNYGYYFQNYQKIYNMNTFLTTGLEIDVPRTLRAIQNPNRLGGTSTALYDIWK